jgi:hypothetical protein
VFNYFKDKVPNPGLFKNELEEAKDVADIDEKIEKYDPNISDVFEMMYDFIDTVVK